MKIKQARAAMAHPAFCGIARQHLGELIEFLQVVRHHELSEATCGGHHFWPGG
ncbi:hypothetical protein ABZ379_48220 [Streptomyces canus]|uniref:hypothetical protein n=1 Tax=Streptomyces canus TaxID=58343 RepID=UPI0033FA916B